MAMLSGKVISVSVPIHVPFTISRESLAAANIVLVELRNAKGLTGLGEGSPFPSLTHDTMESAQAVAEGLLEEIRNLGTAEALQKLRKLKAGIPSITGFVAVEGAIWDLHAREEGKALRELWGAARQATLDTDITLPIMSPEAVTGFWNIYRDYQFQTIKVKVSGQVDTDLDMIRALQKIVPARTLFILDGNQGFTVANAKLLVERLEKDLRIRPIFFEQPLPEKDLAGLAELMRGLPIPVCVDETVRTEDDLRTILDMGLKPIVNIKIMKSGIEEALRIIALAQKSGCELMIGGMLESEVAMGLSLQIACGTGAIRYADLDTPFFFKDWVCVDSPWQRKDACLKLPEGPGHGLSLRSQ